MSALEKWVASAKLSPQMAIKPVQKAIDDPKVYVFGELLALPSVQSVRMAFLSVFPLCSLFCGRFLAFRWFTSVCYHDGVSCNLTQMADCGPEGAQTLSLLRLFAYGTFSDYKGGEFCGSHG